MIEEASIEIEAPPGVVWGVFTAVEQWPDMTASVTKVEGVDGPELAVGRKFRIKQPRLPRVTWTVTELTPGRTWTWVSKTPGNTTSATHEVTSLDDGRTLVHQRIEQGGPGGWLVGHLMRRMTKRYLDMEGQGLKAASERAAASAGHAASA
jgi:uncharacterized membrane protein